MFAQVVKDWRFVLVVEREFARVGSRTFRWRGSGTFSWKSDHPIFGSLWSLLRGVSRCSGETRSRVALVRRGEKSCSALGGDGDRDFDLSLGGERVDRADRGLEASTIPLPSPASSIPPSITASPPSSRRS